MGGVAAGKQTSSAIISLPTSLPSILCGLLSIFHSCGLLSDLSPTLLIFVFFHYLLNSHIFSLCFLSPSLSLSFSSSSLSGSRSLSASSQSHLISHSSFFSLVPYIFLSPTLSSHIFFKSGVTMAFAESLAFGCLMNKFSPNHIPGLRGLPVG